MLTRSAVADSLSREWGLDVPTVVAHDTGMNSRTWLVTAEDRRWVAKAVPTDERERLASGLAVGALVEAAGIPTGAARRTSDGRLLVDIDGHVLALLRYVDGAPLSDHLRDQPRIGVDPRRCPPCAFAGRTVAGAERFHWLDADRPHAVLRKWVRPAITGALGAWQRLEPQRLTWGLLHSDPAPEAFLLDAAGVCGLIDWDRGLVGPLLYDLASAVMYVGGPARATELVTGVSRRWDARPVGGRPRPAPDAPPSLGGPGRLLRLAHRLSRPDGHRRRRGQREGPGGRAAGARR